MTRHFVLGHPSASVRDQIEEMETDLFVMGKHGRALLEELIVGSVTCPLAFRGPEQQTICIRRFCS